MTSPNPEAQFEVREVKIGRGYYVHLMPRNGVPEDIYDFETKHEAQEWGEAEIHRRGKPG
jgi:hypothetical protein